MTKNLPVAQYIVILIFALAMPPLTAFGHGDNSVSLDDSTGILPNSPIFFIDRVMEKVGDFFTFSAPGKITRMLEHAEERLLEFDVLNEKGNVTHAKIALALYNEHLSTTARLLARAKNKREAGAVAITTRIMEHQEILADIVFNNVPQDALYVAILDTVKEGDNLFETALSRLSEEKRKALSEVKKLYDRDRERKLRRTNNVPHPPRPFQN